MHLELVELLRCPAAHAVGVLVAAADTISNRYVTEGVLGCPECHAEYAIRGGITYLSDGTPSREPKQAADACFGPNGVEPMRLAAQLGVNAGRAVYALVGFDVTTMAAVREIIACRMLLLNPPQFDATMFREEIGQDALRVAPAGIVTFGLELPLVSDKFDGIAVRSNSTSPQLLQQCASALRSGGRLVADVSAALPHGVRELVRDEHVWVAERESVASAPVGITRR